MQYGYIDTDIILDTFLNSTEECIVIIDKYGKIVLLSTAYAEFLGVDRDTAIGQHVVDVIENTRMHIVLKTGISETAEVQVIKGKSMIASRIPIIKNGEIVGVFGRVLFKKLSDFYLSYEKFKNTKNELSLYQQTLAETHQARYSIDDIITVNPQMRLLKEMVQKVARTNSGVLLLGESGTGKELFAHAIHHSGKRSHAPFVSVNCGTLPAELLESELFGYEPGAFTGANRQGRIGLIKTADHGTIFLDEIGELSFALQVKLLRFLQEKEIKRIGSNLTEKADVRIVAATNRDLQEMVKQGKFRSDLYYRLNVVSLTLPPLRDRREDIRLLANHTIAKICSRENLPNITVSNDAILCMQEYDWPGNIRELENVLESTINFINQDKIIHVHNLPARITGNTQAGCYSLQQELKEAIDVFEKKFIENALYHNRNNKFRTAEMLGISRTSLYEKLVKYVLSDKKSAKCKDYLTLVASER
jgi:transcriptional regulator with PAS, ATPase and Fis domain